MITFGSFGRPCCGGANPPAWLALILGSAIVFLCVYEVVKNWRRLTGGDIWAALMFFLMGMWVLLLGLGVTSYP
jgi:hypothetical protein